MKLIESDDPRYFTETSDKDYDRHQYKIVYQDGKEKIVEFWEDAKSIWWNTTPQFLSHIEVLDKNVKSKGFK